MRATERRQALLELMCERRQEKIDNLAYEFNVSRATVYRDVLELSLSYPIYTVAGSHNGGVFVQDDYYLGKQYLSDEQKELLETMLVNCDANQKKTMLYIDEEEMANIEKKTDKPFQTAHQSCIGLKQELYKMVGLPQPREADPYLINDYILPLWGEEQKII